MADLQEFITRKAAVAWAWGGADCALFVADWIVEARGVDPAAAWRGRYASAGGCERLLRREGGLEEVFARLAERHGFTERAMADAQEGDVAILMLPALDSRRKRALAPTAAIHFHNRWAVFSAHGVAFLGRLRAPVVRVWAIG